MFIQLNEQGSPSSWPLYANGVKSLHPNTSFPQSLPDNGYPELGIYSLSDGDVPLVDRHQKLEEAEPTLEEGQWTRQWRLVEMSAEEQSATDEEEARKIREERNRRLGYCDWTQLADASIDKTPWLDYRQSLRDLPEQTGFPWDINWPTEPV